MLGSVFDVHTATFLANLGSFLQQVGQGKGEGKETVINIYYGLHAVFCFSQIPS